MSATTAGEAFEKRDLRAATEGIKLEKEAPGMYWARGKYMLDVFQAVCECPDHRFRNNHCKHLRKAEMLEDERDIPPIPDLDEDLREQVEAANDEIAIADGGVRTARPHTPSEELPATDVDEEFSLRAIVGEQTSTIEDLPDFGYDQPAGWHGEPYSSIVGFAYDSVKHLVDAELTTDTESTDQ